MKWKLGKIAGIGVYIHWTFWLLPAFILLSAGGGLGATLSSLVLIAAVFGCVVLHELGHALMARQFHIGTRDITLYPIGGVASLERIPRRPSHELAVALAGPAVNVVIAAVLFVFLLLAGVGTQGWILQMSGGSFLVNLLLINVGLVLFNMLPAFPMDGGRVLRALLAMQLPYLRATEVAVRVGQAVALCLAVAGLFAGGTLVFVALFVFLAAQAELAAARHNEQFGAATIVDAPVVSARSWPDRANQPAPQAESGIVWLDSDVRPPSGFVRFIDIRP